MGKEAYPLKQLVTIKERRLEEAERIFKEKKELLEKENKKLITLEHDRDITKQHKDVKLNQFREELDKGTTSDKIKIMKRYLKVVDNELKQKEKKVDDQKKEVKKSEGAVEVARRDMIIKQRDVEKLKIHKKEWEKEIRKEIAQKETVEADELGAAMHTRRKKKR